MTSKQHPLFVALSLAAAACSSEDPVDIGDDNTATIGQRLEDYAGNWDGYAEAFQFPSGSDRLRITLSATGTGSVEVGDGEPVPPPTDPDVGYFSDVSLHAFDSSAPELVDGFQYPVHDTTLEALRLRFSVAAGDLVLPWCEMQESYPTAGGSFPYSCLPNFPGSYGQAAGSSECYYQVGTSDTPDSLVTVDCGKVHLCADVCACTEAGCNATNSDTISFDSALENDGGQLVGTMHIGSERVTIRLTQAE